MYKKLILAILLWLGPATSSIAQNTWDPWLDLINLQPAAAGLITERDNRGHARKDFDIQRIPEGEGDALNIDEYVVQIGTLPNGWSDTEFFGYVRKNLNSFLDQNSATLKPYKSGDANDWNSGTNAQLGTLMVFDIKINLAPDDLGAVVVSKTGSLSWVFSPVTDGVSELSSDWGTHPVAGNRMFGLRGTSGSYEFFTRGSDRVYPTHVAAFENSAFEGADKLWRSLQANLSSYINQNGGSATVLAPTVPGGNDYTQKPQWAAVCQDADVNTGC